MNDQETQTEEIQTETVTPQPLIKREMNEETEVRVSVDEVYSDDNTTIGMTVTEEQNIEDQGDISPWVTTTISVFSSP